MTLTDLDTATPRLIGLSGYAQSGKDTAGRALVAAGWERRSFADKLREFLYALNPLVLGPIPGGSVRLRDVVDRIGWERAKTENDDVRELLQRCGTDAGRRVLGQNVWVDAALRCLGDTPVVVTDVRFENEAETILDRGGVVVRVERPGIGPKQAPDGTVHPSETSLDGWQFDHVLVNDGTPEDLGRAVLAVARFHWPTCEAAT